MHVGFSIATICLIAMTHVSSFGRPVSQKRENFKGATVSTKTLIEEKDNEASI